MSFPRCACASKTCVSEGSSRSSSWSYPAIRAWARSSTSSTSCESRGTILAAVPSDVLIYADSLRSPEMRHEGPLAVPDPFLYAEHDGKGSVVASSFELGRISEVAPQLEVLPLEEFGLDELYAQGLTRDEIELEVVLRAARRFGLEQVSVPATFPLVVADHLRENGIEVKADRDLFIGRRRVKNAAELAGIRRAQRAAEAAIGAAREVLRAAERQNGALVVDGEPLTCER